MGVDSLRSLGGLGSTMADAVARSARKRAANFMAKRAVAERNRKLNRSGRVEGLWCFLR